MCELWNKAYRDLVTAKLIKDQMQVDEQFRDICCYHLQQCIEKCLKYTLDLKSISYKYTHDLKPLIDTASNIGVDIPVYIKDNVNMINEWESESRYNTNFYALNMEIDNVIQAANALLNSTKDFGKISIDNEKLKGKLLSLFPDRKDDLDKLINDINNAIPKSTLNSYGANKMERVFNFAEIYKKVIYRQE